MPRYDIIHDIEEDGLRFQLKEKGLLRSAKPIRVREWGGSGDADDLAGLAHLLAWQDEEFSKVEEESIRVPHEVIAGLTESTAAALQLPETVPFLLNVEHTGTLDQAEFQFKTSWLKLTGQRLLGVSRYGSMLKVGSKTYRIAGDMYRLLEATDAFNEASTRDEDERLYRWSIVQELLPEPTTRSIKTDGYIRSTRIAHAAAFSLDLKSGSDGFTFDPVLFSSKVADQSIAEPDDFSNPQISESEQLLPDAQQAVFSQQRFNQFDECQRRYALGDGWYVVFDPEARDALNIVRKVQRADRDTRRQFAKNPRSFFRRELGDKFAEPVLERLFIETSEYSQRVKDVGLWQRKVVPWVNRENDSWLPEKFGLKIGDKYVVIDPERVAELKGLARAATDQGKDSFTWEGMMIPTGPETLEAIESLVGLESPRKPDEPEPGPEPEPPDVTPGPVVLVIDDNFNEVEYTRTLTPRAEQPNKDAPVALRATLKQHQNEGLNWLIDSWAAGKSGVLLADDMGLGKTLQALTFLAWLQERMSNQLLKRSPILMVAPVGLLKNWREEVDIHFHEPGLGHQLIAYGKDLQSFRAAGGREIDTGEAVLDTHELQRADWVLTTYETLRDYQHSFGSIRFAAIVYDEVQKIKTPGTLMTEAAQAMNGDFVLALTGTPVENRLADLWCIMDTLQPGVLGGLKTFSAQYERDPQEEDLRSLKDKLMQPVNGVPASMLRRMKVDRLQGLPDKHEHVIERDMPKLQAELYSNAIAQAKVSNRKGAMLKALQDFRSISLHPIHPDQCDGPSYVAESARLAATFDILDDIQGKGQKALIFLESIDMQPVVASLVQRRYKLPKQPMLISGRVSGAKRQDRVNEFQKARKGFDVIILSPRAGGVGLTLTAANHVIHLSRWWNPAVEDQCTDRVYRIGQNREVHVYYPLAIHPAFADTSFDVRLNTLLENKRALSREMLMPPVDQTADAANLFDATVGGRLLNDKATPAPVISLSDIDTMEPLQFEDWVLGKLNENGFDVSRTPKSHDHGADGIATHQKTGRKLIIQCKHSQAEARSDETAVEDLIRARAAYAFENVEFVAVSNSSAYTKRAQQLAKKNDIHLVSRKEIRSWPSTAIDWLSRR